MNIGEREALHRQELKYRDDRIAMLERELEEARERYDLLAQDYAGADADRRGYEARQERLVNIARQYIGRADDCGGLARAVCDATSAPAELIEQRNTLERELADEERETAHLNKRLEECRRELAEARYDGELLNRACDARDEARRERDTALRELTDARAQVEAWRVRSNAHQEAARCAELGAKDAEARLAAALEWVDKAYIVVVNGERFISQRTMRAALTAPAEPMPVTEPEIEAAIEQGRQDAEAFDAVHRRGGFRP